MNTKYHKAFDCEFDDCKVHFVIHYNLSGPDELPMQITAQWWVDVEEQNQSGQFFEQHYPMPNEVSALSFIRDYSGASAQDLVDSETVL